MSKILVTGATGFLGRFIINELIENGYYVIAFGRNEAIGKELENKNVKFIKGELSSFEDVKRAVNLSDMVVHAGALTTVWGKWKDFYNSNVLGTKNIIDASLESGIKKMIYVSSSSVYASCEDKFNIKEEDFFNKNHCLNYYIKSKLMSEELINNLDKNQLYTNIVRPHGIIGNGDKCIVPRILEANKKIGIPIFNDGNVFIDMAPAENVAFAIRLCLENDNLNKEAFNITNGDYRKFKDMVNDLFFHLGITPRFFKANRKLFYNYGAFLEQLYKTLNITKTEPILTRYKITTVAYSETFDISKAKKLLGYYPKVSLEESFKSYEK